jgi:chemotaxis protein methyltransferase CheR
MFRDPSFFSLAFSKWKPHLRNLTATIKVWIAGCSTEEVYLLAILLREEGLLERSRIYATDINPCL